MEWKSISIQNGPSPRYGHSATIVNGELYIFGGHLSQALFSRNFAINKKDHVLNDLWKLDLGNSNDHYKNFSE
jgi:hypothetical protein